MLPLETQTTLPDRLMVAGPRESKWPGARVETDRILRCVDFELRALSAKRDAARYIS